MFSEDNNGFVFFPFGNRININTGDKTLVYLVAFEPTRFTGNQSSISNVRVTLPGDFVSDDVIDRSGSSDASVNENLQRIYDKIYFPNYGNDNEIERTLSMPMVTSICIGWSNDSYEFRDGTPWKATYRDLTEEGKKLYYSIKKLHNNKEVRILTFNNI